MITGRFIDQDNHSWNRSNNKVINSKNSIAIQAFDGWQTWTTTIEIKQQTTMQSTAISHPSVGLKPVHSSPQEVIGEQQVFALSSVQGSAAALTPSQKVLADD